MSEFIYFKNAEYFPNFPLNKISTTHQPMTYIVTDNCQKCKYTDCVLVCPVDCFYENDDQLVINPEECIDCSACVPECPVEAIYSEDELPEEQSHWLEYNAEESERLIEAGVEPIVDQKDPLPTAEAKRAALGL